MTNDNPDTFTVAGQDFVKLVKDIHMLTRVGEFTSEVAITQLQYLRSGLPTIGDHPLAKELYLKLIELCDITIKQIKKGMN